MRIQTVIALGVLLFFSSQNAFAQELISKSVQDQLSKMQASLEKLQSTVDNQNEVIRSQQTQIVSLENKLDKNIYRLSQAGDREPAAEPRPSKSSPGFFGLSQGFNPDIGVVGVVQGNVSRNNTEDADGNDTIAMKELELNFGSYVDPYSRFDAVLSFNDALEEQNVEIEEAYYTRWGLPLGFTGKAGKFRAKIGKQNLLHLEQLDTVDYPVVIRDFFGEEGLASSGVRLTNQIPNPWDIPLEISGELLRGNNGNSFSGISRRPILDTHLKTFFELSDVMNLELGGTAMFGDENIPRSMIDSTGAEVFVRSTKGGDRYGVHVLGWDATLIRNMSEGRTLKVQSEFYLEDRTKLVVPNSTPWGLYTLIDYRFSPSWSVGIRFDYLDPLEMADKGFRSSAISPYITLWQSEFANFVLQYTHSEPFLPNQRSDDAVYLKANITIGIDKHPVQ
ncbi:MAG: hypothetical protein HZC17_09210 [Candidatus Omnitrophica bacterium]|nr:hypothetical protein [Candidatus Omnitrophota bacterium]